MLTVENILYLLEQDICHIRNYETENMDDKMVCLWNVGGYQIPFYYPIVDMYMETISSNRLYAMRNEKVFDLEVIQIVQAINKKNIKNIITQREFIKKLSMYPQNLLVVTGGHNKKEWAISPINIVSIKTNDKDAMKEIKVVNFMKPYLGKENYIGLLM